MSRPAVEVADVLHAQGDRFIQRHPWLSVQQRTVLRALTRCRTAALGGHVDRCRACGHRAISYNSCRNRHCPKCQAQARDRWLAARERELLDVSYVHVVFTLPHALNPLCRRNATRLYHVLFRTGASTLLEVAADPKHLGAAIGFLSILHTWGQTLVDAHRDGISPTVRPAPCCRAASCAFGSLAFSRISVVPRDSRSRDAYSDSSRR